MICLLIRLLSLLFIFHFRKKKYFDILAQLAVTDLMWLIISTAPPRFTRKPPTFIFIKEGGNLTLSISASGKPQPKITWSIRNKTQGNKRRVNITGNKFEIKSVRFEDKGVITCRAENVFGVQENEIELTVLGE